MTWVMWNLPSFHLETVFVLVQDRCMVRARCTICSEITLTHLMVPLGDKGSSGKHVSIHLEIVLILMHDRCTVCVKRTIGSEIILDAHDGTAR